MRIKTCLLVLFWVLGSCVSSVALPPLFLSILFKVKGPVHGSSSKKIADIAKITLSFKDPEGKIKSFSCPVNKAEAAKIQRAHELPLCPATRCKDIYLDVCRKNIPELELCFNPRGKIGARPDSFAKIMWDKGFRCDPRPCLKHEKCSGWSEKTEWVRDYSRYMGLSLRALSDCVNSFDQAATRSDENLGALLLAMKSVEPYDIDTEDGKEGRWTANFRSPASVIQKGGDCDSRAALLVALLKRGQRKVVILRSILLWNDPSGHGTAMVGVERDGGNEGSKEKNEAFEKWETKEIKAGDKEIEVNGTTYSFIAVMKSDMPFGVVDSAWAGLYRVIPIRTDKEIIPPSGLPCVERSAQEY